MSRESEAGGKKRSDLLDILVVVKEPTIPGGSDGMKVVYTVFGRTMGRMVYFVQATHSLGQLAGVLSRELGKDRKTVMKVLQGLLGDVLPATSQVRSVKYRGAASIDLDLLISQLSTMSWVWQQLASQVGRFTGLRQRFEHELFSFEEGPDRTVGM